jgi:hypothetical protein
VRLSAGLYDLREAARLIDLPEQTFRRWARGYEYGAPLLHMLDRDARRESSVPFIALAEAWVLDGLRRAGVRPRKIRPGLDELKRQFGAEYVLMAPELATDGVDLLWDFSRTKAGEGLIEARSRIRCAHPAELIVVSMWVACCPGIWLLWGNRPHVLRRK